MGRELKIEKTVKIEVCEADVFFVDEIGEGESEDGAEMLIGRRALWKRLSTIFPRAVRKPRAPKTNEAPKKRGRPAASMPNTTTTA